MADMMLRSGSRPWGCLPFSQAGWERFGDLIGLPQGVPLQRLDRPRLIEVQHEIELLPALSPQRHTTPAYRSDMLGHQDNAPQRRQEQIETLSGGWQVQ
jgi:hypothetical protein